MWTWFRAVAERIGLSREEVERVERGGEPTWVQDPLNEQVHYRVRPDADWTQRMGDAWHGELQNSRRQAAGTLYVPDGHLLIADPSSPERTISAAVVPGEYEVVLTIAWMGAEEEGDYEEHVSHAFALLRDSDEVAAIEPLTGEDGSELGIEASRIAFTVEGVMERLAAEHVGGRAWAIDDSLIPAMYNADPAGGMWAKLVPADGSGALIAVAAGHGRDDYPIFRIDDLNGKMVGVLLDFFVDNRTD